MAIFTRYGSQVEIVAQVNGWRDRTSYTGDYLAFRRVDDGKQLTGTMADLRADGGFAEIDKAIEAAPVVDKL